MNIHTFFQSTTRSFPLPVVHCGKVYKYSGLADVSSLPSQLQPGEGVYVRNGVTVLGLPSQKGKR